MPIAVLPRVLKVFLERVGEGAHNMAHFYEDCNFSYTLFNDNMRTSLLNTKRHLKRRETIPAILPVKRKRSPALPRVPGVDEKEVADELCGFLGWDTGPSLGFVLRRVRVRIAFPKDPLYEDAALQAAFKELEENAAAGRIDDAKENLQFIKNSKAVDL